MSQTVAGEVIHTAIADAFEPVTSAGVCVECRQRVTLRTEAIATRKNEPYTWLFSVRDLDHDTPHLCKGASAR